MFNKVVIVLALGMREAKDLYVSIGGVKEAFEVRQSRVEDQTRRRSQKVKSSSEKCYHGVVAP